MKPKEADADKISFQILLLKVGMILWCSVALICPSSQGCMAYIFQAEFCSVLVTVQTQSNFIIGCPSVCRSTGLYLVQAQLRDYTGPLVKTITVMGAKILFCLDANIDAYHLEVTDIMSCVIL